MKTINVVFRIARKLQLVYVALLILLITSCNTGEKVSSGLLLGIAEVNYTPAVGLNLVGNYRGDDYASRGVHDSLYSRAIVAQGENGEKVAVVSVDICYLNKEPVEFMRNYIASMTDLKPENIMFTATHTHSGPPSNLDSPQAKDYLSKIADAVIEANEKLVPTSLAIGRSQENRISHNRRLECIDGTTHMCWEKFEPGFVIGPLGPIDPEVTTISVIQNGNPTGVIVNFGCHATTLTGNNWLYSADYPGYLVESIRKVKGKDYMPMFLNGPCGNVTQVDYKVGFPDTYQECQRIGYMLGVSAIEAINNEIPVSNNNIVAVSKEMVPLKRMRITEQQFEWAKQIMAKVDKEGMPPAQADGIPDAEYAIRWLKMHKEQNDVDSVELMVVRIGDVAFVGMPGEVFCEFGIDIKEKSPFENTLVMGLTNGTAGYLPTEISFTQGPKGFTPMITGYETTPGTSKYDIGSGEKLMESALKQLRVLAGTTEL